jgi:predicted 3-demethylubiquinone-9 3-methyltransferase (glyoxalase superfamily)
MSNTITPNLWFDGNAEEAVNFYLSVFPESKILSTMYYPKTKEEGLADFQMDLAGKVLTIEFELRGNRFTAINADSTFKFNEAVSFAVACKDQEEIDYYWEKLSADPAFEQCGWLKDKYGLSWQIVPENTEELLKRPGAFAKMMEMKKIIIADY